LDLYRIDVVIDAMAELAARGVDARLALYGDGPARAALEAQAAARGIDHAVRFYGAVSAYEVEQAIARADVYVSVAESDGVSLALLEALAIGVAPVLSDIPANRPWIVDGSTGKLTAIEAPALADAIVAASQLDRARLIADNRSVVAERADRDTNLGACELLIDSLIGVSWEALPSDAPVSGEEAA
jgi:glycosyltransferase involved in cell wall biosynthesis